MAHRDYAYNELFTKLKPHALNEAELCCVLDELQQKGWLSEERYINSYINSKSKKYGLLKIKYLLYNKSDKHDLVDDLLQNTEINEFEVAYQLWEKKFDGIVFTQLDQKQILRGMRFLQNRGFSFDIINKVLAKIKQNPS